MPSRGEARPQPLPLRVKVPWEGGAVELGFVHEAPQRRSVPTFPTTRHLHPREIKPAFLLEECLQHFGVRMANVALW